MHRSVLCWIYKPVTRILTGPRSPRFSQANSCKILSNFLVLTPWTSWSLSFWVRLKVVKIFISFVWPGVSVQSFPTDLSKGGVLKDCLVNSHISSSPTVKQISFVLSSEIGQSILMFQGHKEATESYAEEWVQWVLAAPLVVTDGLTGWGVVVLDSLQVAGRLPFPWCCPRPGALWILWFSIPALCPPGHVWWAPFSHSTFSTPTTDMCTTVCVRLL